MCWREHCVVVVDDNDGGGGGGEGAACVDGARSVLDIVLFMAQCMKIEAGSRRFKYDGGVHCARGVFIF